MQVIKSQSFLRRTFVCVHRSVPQLIASKKSVSSSNDIQPIKNFCRIGDSIRFENYIREGNIQRNLAGANLLYKDSSPVNIDMDLKQTLSEATSMVELLNLVNEKTSPEEALHIFFATRQLMTFRELSDNFIGPGRELGIGLYLFDIPHKSAYEDFKRDFLNHANHDLLIQKLQLGIPSFSTNTISLLFALLSKYGEVNTNDIMCQLFIALKRSVSEADLDTMYNFVNGCVSQLDLNLGYTQLVRALRNNVLTTFIWRLEECVDALETPKDVETLVYICLFSAHVMSDEKTNYFTGKIARMIDDGILDPKRAKNQEELYDILDILIRVSLLIFRKKSHFDFEFENMSVVFEKLIDYVDHLSPFQCILLGRVVHFVGHPATLFNRVSQRLKHVLTTDGISPLLPKSDIIFLLSNNSIVKRTVRSLNAVEGLLDEWGASMKLEELLELTSQPDFAQAYKNLVHDTVSTFKHDVHTLAIIASPKRGLLNFVDEDLSKEIHEIFLNYAESSPITRISSFELIVHNLITSKYPLPHWFPDRMADCLSNANARFLMKQANDIYKLPQVRVRLLNADMDRVLLKSFFRSLDELEQTPARLRSLNLLGVYVSIGNLLDDEQRKQVESSSFWQTIQNPPNTLGSNRVVAVRLISAADTSRYDLSDIVKTVIERVSHYEDVRLASLEVFSRLYSIFEPDIDEECKARFCKLMSDSLERDLEFTSKTQVMDVASFLVMHHDLKPELIVKIFDKRFIEGIEQEKTGLAGAMYKLTMSILARLNQLVCAKYPQYRIPWFNEKTMKSQGLRAPNPKPDLIDTLNKIFTDEYFDENVRSSLWFPMDIELAYDKTYQEFMPVYKRKFRNEERYHSSKLSRNDTDTQRVAIIFHNSEQSYTSNTKKLINVKLKENIKGLEFEGYIVIEIDYFKWNKMAMATANGQGRVEYLQSLFEEKGLKIQSKTGVSYM